MSKGIEGMLKIQAWETAKGALRACVALTGSTIAPTREIQKYNTEQWKEFDQTVQDFISHVENYGLYE